MLPDRDSLRQLGTAWFGGQPSTDSGLGPPIPGTRSSVYSIDAPPLSPGADLRTVFHGPRCRLDDAGEARPLVGVVAEDEIHTRGTTIDRNARIISTNDAAGRPPAIFEVRREPVGEVVMPA